MNLIKLQTREFIEIAKTSIKIVNILSKVMDKDQIVASALILLGLTIFKDDKISNEQVDKMITNLRYFLPLETENEN